MLSSHLLNQKIQVCFSHFTIIIHPPALSLMEGNHEIAENAELDLYSEHKRIFIAKSQDAINQKNRKVFIVVEFVPPYDCKWGVWCQIGNCLK